MTFSEPVMEAGPAERVQALIDITESLNLIFDEENIALEESRPRDIAPLQAEKARLAAAYAQSIRAVAADRSGVAALDNELLFQLRAITNDFETLAARQRMLLDNANHAGEDIMAAISKNTAGDAPAYSGERPRPAPVSFDESA